MSGTIKLENGLRRALFAPIQANGTWGEILDVAKLTQITAQTAEGENQLAAGNMTIYSKKSKGKTTGTIGFYGITPEVQRKIFGTKLNSDGLELSGQKDEKPLGALILEFTAVNPDTNMEEDGFMIFPKTSLGELSDEVASKDADGNETINAKSLSYTALPLDNKNKTYKAKGFGETPTEITAEMFNPAEENTDSRAKVGFAKVGESTVA